MTNSRPSRLLAASPPLLTAVLIVKLWIVGTLRFYVNDRTVWIVLLGAVLFAAVGLAALRSAWIGTREAPPLSWRTAAFLLPVLAGLVVPARPLSAATGQSSSLGALQLASHVSAAGSGDQFGSWVNDLAGHSDPSWWTGQHVTLVGFVSNQVGLPGRSFIIGRYLVTCCVVDATMFGFPVHMDTGPQPGQGAWVQVSGIFGRRFWTDPAGQQYPIVEHAHMTRVTIPSSPYLSPS